MDVCWSTLLKEEEIDQTFSTTVGFSNRFPSRIFSFNPKEVLVTIPVDEFTEGEITVAINISNLPGAYNAKTFPDSVKIKYQVALSKYNRVKPEHFRVLVELPDASEFSARSKLTIAIAKQPEFVNIMQLEPERVEYFVRE